MQKRRSSPDIVANFFAVLLGTGSLCISGQAAGQVAEQAAIIETLVPDQSQYVYNTRIAADIDGDTALVASQLNERVFVMQREPAGRWQETAQLRPPAGADTFGLFGQKLAVSNNTAIVAFGPRLAENTLQIYRRNGDSWEQGENITVPIQSTNAFHLSDSGNRVLVNSSTANAMIHRIYRIDTDGALVEEFSQQVNENVIRYASPEICIHQDIAVIDNQWFRQTDGEWINQGGTGIDIVANQINEVFYSKDCRHAFYSIKNSDEPSTNIIYQFAGDDGWTEVHRFFGASGFFSSVFNAVINENFAIIQFYYIGDGENAEFLLLESDENQSWIEKGNLIPLQNTGGFGHFLALDGTTALISSYTPGEVSAYDLSRYDELNTLRPAPQCLSGFSDPDGDGFGIENDEQCVVPPNRIPVDDNRRDSIFATDTTYTGPSPDTFTSTDGTVVEPATVLSGNLAARVVQGGNAEQVMVEILTTDNQLETTIDISGLWQQFINTSFYPPSVSAIRIDLDQQILAISIPAIPGSSTFSGLIFIYERNSNAEWVQTAQLPGFNTDWDSYGQAISLVDGYLAVRSGDVGGEGGAVGTIFIYKQENSEWVLDSELVEPRLHNPNPQIGYALSINSDVLLLANQVSGFNFSEIYVRNADREWQHQQTLYTGDGRTRIDGVDLINPNTALIELNGEIHVFGEDNNGVWRETAVTTGGDMVIRHGRLWAGDAPLLPENGTASLLFPVEFLTQNNLIEETGLTTDSSPDNSSSDSSTSDSSVSTSDLAPDELATPNSGGGSFSLFYLPGIWWLIIINRNHRASHRKVKKSSGR